MDIYFDNASTTFPKPKKVLDDMYYFMNNIGGNSNRSTHENSLSSDRLLYDARCTIADFFNYNKVENVIFTNNVTTALNTLLLGSLKKGDHVITSSMEHNSILRPLTYLENNSIISLTIIEGNKDGFISLDKIESSINENTKIMVFSICSNVTGSIQDIYKIGQICKKNNIFFILDSAQGAGSLNIDMKLNNISALAFTGHKGLYGPQGIGGFIIDDEFNKICNPIIFGGTGSTSYSLFQPDFLPDKFESGTMNLPGVVGLKAGIDFINSVGIKNINSKINVLHKYLLDGLLALDNYVVYGDKTGLYSSSLVSFNHINYECAELSFILSENGIKHRSGLHCAPLAHKTIGTYPSGTIRLSLSYFNTKEEIDYTLGILNSIK